MKLSIPLTVANPLSFPRVQEPVITGVPIPQRCGLRDVAAVTLQDEKGRYVRTQFEPLAWWSDGSIKWLLVQFRCELASQASKRYYLKLWDGEDEEDAPAPIASQSANKVHLDTGALRATLGASDGLFSNLELYDHKQDGWISVVKGCGGLPRMKIVTAAGKTLEWSRPHALDIELNGAERAIVKLSGWFVDDQKQPSDFSYELRLAVFRDSQQLELMHRLINHRQENHLTELALVIPVQQARYTLGNETEVTARHVLSGTEQVYGVLQESEDAGVSGWLDDSGMCTPFTARQQWWLAAQLDSFSLVTTTAHFYQRYPKSLEGGATSVKVGLLPGRSATKDSFMPANQLVDRYVLKEGESRTHKVLLAFTRESDSLATKQADDWQQQAIAFHYPLRALAPWQWYCSSGALGDLVPRSSQFRPYEQAVDESLRIFLDRRETLRLYGDRNFGDDQDAKPGSWNNGEYDYAHVGMCHFFRGAGWAWFEQVAAPYAQHMMDIDVCLSGPGQGRVHQHTVWHNQEPPKLGSHAWLRGLLTYYCFTGDLFARDTAKLIADTWSQLILSNAQLEATERGMTWPVISMLAMYQTFPEVRYLEAATKLIEQVLRLQDPVEGHFTGSMDRPTTKDRWGTFIIGSPVLESLVMYYQLTQDERAKQAVVKAAKRLARLNWLEEIGAWEYTHSKLISDERIHNAKTDKMVTPAVLYGYLYSQDEELLEKALRAFQYSEATPARNGKDLGQTYCFGVRIPALIQQAFAQRQTRAE